MASKLTQREKVLAWATGGTLVIGLVFGAFLYFLSAYNANEAKYRSVVTRTEAEEAKTTLGIQASKRKQYYLKTSVPEKVDIAKTQYIAWLTKTFREDLKVTLASVEPASTDQIRYAGNRIATQMTYGIRPVLTLDQLVQFLEKFYAVDTLHQISSLKLTPKTELVRGKRIRTGMLTAAITIKVLAVEGAEDKKTVARYFQDSGITLQQARDSIVRRDIFGPANNAPTLKATTRSSYVSEKTATIKVAANDADAEDHLTIELLKSDVEDADLQVDKNGRVAALKLPGQKAGSYKFLLKVTDSGLPAKTTQKLVTVRFADAKKPKQKIVKPPIKRALETRITGNLRDREGNWIVLIKSQMDGVSYRLKVGETFKLDDQEWEVVSISKDSSTLRVGDENLTFGQGDAFSDPVKRVAVK